MPDINILVMGACIMFYVMTAFIFWRKHEKLSNLVALLMFTIAIQYCKDVFVFTYYSFSNEAMWTIHTAIDMVAVPMYAFILMELVRPGMVNMRTIVIHEIPFVVLPLLLILFKHHIFFYILVVYAAIYGTYILIWTARNIPRYHEQLKAYFSYTENINLNWLRLILYTFYVILALWILDCVLIHVGIELIYSLASLMLWMVLDIFIYKHENVLDELNDYTPEVETCPCCEQPEVRDENSLAARIEALFTERQLYKDPNLKLSDVAREAGSNRTYVSNYFNHDISRTFYDYVNGFRINHAIDLLQHTDLTIQEIAHETGFSSSSTFSRVFSKYQACSPSDYRRKNGYGGGKKR